MTFLCLKDRTINVDHVIMIEGTEDHNTRIRLSTGMCVRVFVTYGEFMESLSKDNTVECRSTAEGQNDN